MGQFEHLLSASGIKGTYSGPYRFLVFPRVPVDWWFKSSRCGFLREAGRSTLLRDRKWIKLGSFLPLLCESDFNFVSVYGMEKQKKELAYDLSGGESNPALPRDRRVY